MDAWRPSTDEIQKRERGYSCHAPSRSFAMSSSQQPSGPNHYNGPINPLNYALRGAVADTYSQTNQNRKHASDYKGCPSTRCGYSTPKCNAPIDCGNASEHLRVKHGVRDIGRSEHITCGWEGCGQSVLRNNFLRHIREVHLEHTRNNTGR